MEQAKYLEDQGWTYKIEASFLEIYNETVKDLMTDKKSANVDIKLDPENDSVHVPGLTKVGTFT